MPDDTNQAMGRDAGGLSPAAQKHESWNYWILIFQGTALDLGRVFASPRLVLPYLYISFGAPALLAGLLIPIVQIARMVSQLVVAPRIASASTRKWFMVVGVTIMGTAIIVIAVAARQLETLPLAILFLAVAFVLGVGQGINTLAFQTMLRHIMSRERQSRLLLSQQAIGGALAIVVAVGTYYWLDFGDSLSNHLALLWVGVGAIMVSTLVAGCVREFYGSTEPVARKLEPHDESEQQSQHLDGTILGGFKLLREVPWFRRFCVLRCLLLSIELAMPFYAIHAALPHSQTSGTLHAFVIASSLGMMASGFVWRWQTRWPLRVTICAAAIVAACSAVTAILIEVVPGMDEFYWHMAVFFLIALAAKGVGVAHRVFLNSSSPQTDTAYFISVSDAITGLVAIVFAFALGAMAHLAHAIWPVVILLILNLGAAAYALSLPTEEKAIDSAST